jgi:16S rRNA (cytidine1402-2'-O)-methyltransferase
LLDNLEVETGTILLYESPHRLKKTLAVIAERWSGRGAAIVRELTKRHEEAVRGTVQACLDYIEQHPPLGECCIVLQGKPAAVEGMGSEGQDVVAAGVWWAALTLVQHVEAYEAKQQTRKEAMKSAATDRGLSRRDVYQALLDEERS